MTTRLFQRKGILLIEDDPVFATLVSSVARAERLPLTVHSSLAELGTFARLGEFDVVILDYNLDNINGVEISEYVTAFFQNVPVILISAYSSEDFREKQWPPSVRRFISKNAGVRMILDAAMAEIGPGTAHLDESDQARL